MSSFWASPGFLLEKQGLGRPGCLSPASPEPLSFPRLLSSSVPTQTAVHLPAALSLARAPMTPEARCLPIVAGLLPFEICEQLTSPLGSKAEPQS